MLAGRKCRAARGIRPDLITLDCAFARSPRRAAHESSSFKRRQFLKAAGIGVAATAIAKPAIAQTNPAIKWRLTSSFPKSLDTLYGAMETVARFVAESTDNQFQMQTFAAGEIVPGLNAMDASAAAPSRRATPQPITISARTRPSRCSAPFRSDSIPASRMLGFTTATA